MEIYNYGIINMTMTTNEIARRGALNHSIFLATSCSVLLATSCSIFLATSCSVLLATSNDNLLLNHSILLATSNDNLLLKIYVALLQLYCCAVVAVVALDGNFEGKNCENYAHLSPTTNYKIDMSIKKVFNVSRPFCANYKIDRLLKKFFNVVNMTTN